MEFSTVMVESPLVAFYLKFDFIHGPVNGAIHFPRPAHGLKEKWPFPDEYLSHMPEPLHPQGHPHIFHPGKISLKTPDPLLRPGP
jgi:hypothetical protein